MRLLLAGLLPLVLAAPAAAADITVTSRVEAVVLNDGRCSLREAITAASTNAASGTAPGECASGETALDVVHLGAGTYTLTGDARDDANAGGDLDVIGGALELRGAGRDVTTISADRVDRVVDVVGPDAVVTISGLTLTDGRAPNGTASELPEPGGGIRSAGTLTVRDSAIAGNRAGNGAPGDPAGIAGGGSGAHGGGVYATGAIAVIGSRVTGNAAGDGGRGADAVNGGGGGAGGDGGGINAGELTLERSTVAGNRAGAGGRGGFGFATRGGHGGGGGWGGGVFAAVATITGTLLSGNEAGHGGGGGEGGVGAGGIPGSGGDGGHGGNLLAGAAAEVVSSTLIDGVSGTGGPPAPFPFGGAHGDPGAGSAVRGTATLTRSILGGTCARNVTDGGQNVSAAVDCPGAVGDLRLDGFAPGAGSPAIDAATTCPDADLAGTSRPQGVACDIGAYEVRVVDATVAPAALAFDPLTVGTGPATLTVRATNPGLAGLLPALAVRGADFTLASHTCGAVLATACDVAVAFAPSQAGTRSGTLSVAGRTVALTGTGLAPPPPPPAAVRQCVVPRLKGRTLVAAARALQQANCRLGTVTRRGRGRRGRVRSFSPKAGTSLPAGTTVRLVLNRRPRR